MRYFCIFVVMMGLLPLFSCGAKQQKEQLNTEITALSVKFDADSAFSYVKRQVGFGARVPNTDAHQACADYLSEEMKRFGTKVIVQEASVRAYNGAQLSIRNIIASINSEQSDRILLFAHWDSRPFADHDPDPSNHRKPILGANDGASGVAILMEVARQLQIKAPTIGVDIVFFDAEDYGTPEWDEAAQGIEDTWCLGSQYWAKHPHEAGYTARYGILLDMVGGIEPKFYREQVSEYFAQPIVSKVWNTAKRLGFEQFFINQQGGAVTDDHLYINQIIGIPSIDIIDHDSSRKKGFPDTWHTVKDNLDNIDPSTLKMVGQVVLEIIYNEK